MTMTTRLMLTRDDDGRAIVQVWTTVDGEERVSWVTFAADIVEAIRYARSLAEQADGVYNASIVDGLTV